MARTITQSELEQRKKQGAIVKRKNKKPQPGPSPQKKKEASLVEPAMMHAAKSSMDAANAARKAADAATKGITDLAGVVGALNSGRSKRLQIHRDHRGLIDYIDVKVKE